MELSDEQIEQALANEEVAGKIIAKTLSNESYVPKITDHLSNQGFFVLPKDKQQSILQEIEEKGADIQAPGFLNEFKERYAKPLVRSVHDKYDSDLKELGIERQQNEKTYEALKRSFSSTQEKIRDLEEKIASGKGTEAMQQKIKELEEKAANDIAEWKNKYEDATGQLSTFKKSQGINGIYADIKAKFKPADQLGNFFKSHEKAVLEEVTKNSVEEDGVWYLTDKEGSIQKDSNWNKVKVSDYLQEQFKDAIQEDPKRKGGAGTDPERGGPGSIDPTTLTPENYATISEVKNERDLLDDLLKQGLVQGTKQFTEIFASELAKLKQKA
jgi:hypothetical protein